MKLIENLLRHKVGIGFHQNESIFPFGAKFAKERINTRTMDGVYLGISPEKKSGRSSGLSENIWNDKEKKKRVASLKKIEDQNHLPGNSFFHFLSDERPGKTHLWQFKI